MAKTIRQDWFDWLDNTLVGSDPNDIDEEFRGGGGNDKIAGGVGDDWVRGGDDNDKLFGDNGDDTVDGDAGNDWLTGGAGTDILNGGSGADRLFFSGQDAYNGGSGTDVFDARTFGYIDVVASGGHNLTTVISDTQGVRIGLENGVAEFRGTGSAANEDHYGEGLLGIGRGVASFSSIEQYDLTDFGDYFEGDNTSDVINGFAGNDVIEGKGGADTINGGTGIDTVEYGSQGLEGFLEPVDNSNNFGVNVDLERGTGLLGDAEGDVYTSIENVRGSAFLDALWGDDGVNKIMGRGGDDFIEGRGGADILDGGTGIDEAMYASSTAGVNIDLSRATQLFGDAQSDQLIDIENASGSAFSDTLRGNSGANKLSGLDGSDIIDGGHGNDILIGGGGLGVDTVSFESWDPTGLSFTPTINITLGQNGGVGHATETTSFFNSLTRQFVTTTETDDLYGFENVRGSNFRETITGNELSNVLSGRGGDDTLNGGGATDLLFGGEGLDILSGGAGSDIFQFLSVAELPIFGFSSGQAVIPLERITDFQDDGLNQDVIDLSAIRTNTGGRLFFGDGDANFYELGEVMVFTDTAGRTQISADINGDGGLDFAIAFDHQISTLDRGDFIF
ncbi:MAG: calcium-binding protein [Hyphomicrobiaceae bacterium]